MIQKTEDELAAFICLHNIIAKENDLLSKLEGKQVIVK